MLQNLTRASVHSEQVPVTLSLSLQMSQMKKNLAPDGLNKLEKNFCRIYLVKINLNCALSFSKDWHSTSNSILKRKTGESVFIFFLHYQFKISFTLSYKRFLLCQR